LIKTPQQLKAVDKEPGSYKLAKSLQRAGIRGGFRLENMLRNKGCLDLRVRHELPNNVLIDIPIAERSYDFYEITHYEADSIKQIAPIISSYKAEFCLLDCGADIGLMSAKFVSAFPEIKEVISFEPNHISFQFLEENLSLLNIDAKALNMGVGDFNGLAELRVPDFDSHDHAAYVVPSEDGDFRVTTIDDIDLSNNRSLFIKIDVEGAELSVIKGAEKSIASAENIIILFEAHPKQVKRTNVDPTEIIKKVCSIQDCEIVVMEAPGENIDLNRDFFEQFPQKVFNICLSSK